MIADAVVVGAGVVGSSIALELARSGFDVVVVDKAPGIGHGSTSASSAVVRFNFSTREGVDSVWESYATWRDWSGYLRSTGTDASLAQYVRSGIAMLDVEIAPRESYLPHFDAVGIPYEEWEAEDLLRSIPGIDVGRYWPPKRVDDEAFWDESRSTLGAVYTPDGGYVNDPQLAAQNLADAASADGARFLLRREVTRIEKQHGRVKAVHLTSGETISCGLVVNAAGPWSTQVNAMAGAGDDFTIGLRPMRQEVHQVAAPPELAQSPICFADMDLGVYIRPEGSSHLLVGGTEPACDPIQWLDDPDLADPHPTAAVFEAQSLRAAKRLSTMRVPTRPQGVAGVYDVADDWTPIYDQTDVPGFYVAVGTSGNQFKNAPIIGQFMTAIIQQVENGVSHDDHPVLFQTRHTGATIPLSAYSRLRPHNESSSHTVMG